MKGSLFSLLQKAKVFGIRTNRAKSTQLQFVSRKSRRSQRQGVAIYQQLTKKKGEAKYNYKQLTKRSSGKI